MRKHLCVILVVQPQTQGRLIERWKKEGKSNREIASLLGKAPQTIHTEIKRGTVRQCLGKGRFKEIYSADYAQQS
ncbi:transposase [Streptococcus pneumoniae]|nr:transposase [Streptococcus pneumoniae]